MKTGKSHSRLEPAWTDGQKGSGSGFTLIELLVVIAILVILAGLLMPSLTRAKSRAQSVLCVNHLKQLGLSWQLYADDHEAQVPPNSVEASGPHKTWVQGWLNYRPDNPDNTNTIYLRESHLWPYHQSLRLWKCPQDKSTSTQGGRVFARARSYSMNPFLNPRCETTPWRQFGRTSDFIDPPPAQTFVLIDEREDSINNGVFSVVMDKEAIGDWPANYHHGASALVFADGHTELKKWIDARTKPAFERGQLLQTGGIPSPGNNDVAWLQARTTARAGSH